MLFFFLTWSSPIIINAKGIAFKSKLVLNTLLCSLSLKTKGKFYFLHKWFQMQRELVTPYEEMSFSEILFVSEKTRRQVLDKKKTFTTIRAALDHHLRSPPFSKPFLFIGDSQFNDANTSLSNFLKNPSERAVQWLQQCTSNL